MQYFAYCFWIFPYIFRDMNFWKLTPQRMLYLSHWVSKAKQTFILIWKIPIFRQRLCFTLHLRELMEYSPNINDWDTDKKSLLLSSYAKNAIEFKKKSLDHLQFFCFCFRLWGIFNLSAEEARNNMPIPPPVEGLIKT